MFTRGFAVHAAFPPKSDREVWKVYTKIRQETLRKRQSLSDSFARKGIRSLEEPVADVPNGYNLANDKVRNLYTSLTGDEIQEQPFWGNFIRSAKRRDNIIRKGLIVGRSDAEESFKTVNDFLAHLTEQISGSG